ncbi:glycosyltransferase [Papillibacter cinnamivorans]|uniref:glycosyltransferase n=1 Tax=Papillibacter cinnamivorans TaxID=100176 RepID=UPI0013564F59|nr:glycosyltransferase [Papillibacter cinnamivorans]
MTFCYAGSLTRHKGVHLLLDAFRGLKGDGTGLLIYGSGPGEYERRLRALAGDDGRIRFMGVYAPEDTASVFGGCDVVVIPSVWYENYPLVMHEALMSRVPVLASGIGGMSEKIKDGWNGNTFRVGDVEDLRQKMRDIVAHPSVLNQYKENLSGLLLPTVEQEASRYLKIFEELKLSRERA